MQQFYCNSLMGCCDCQVMCKRKNEVCLIAPPGWKAALPWKFSALAKTQTPVRHLKLEGRTSQRCSICFKHIQWQSWRKRRQWPLPEEVKKRKPVFHRVGSRTKVNLDRAFCEWRELKDREQLCVHSTGIVSAALESVVQEFPCTP